MSDTDLHYLCNENVVVYKRKNSRTNCWYARVKLAHNNRWKKFTTKTEDLNEALKFAETHFSVLKELINHGVAVDTRRFSHVADLVIKEMEDQLKAGTGKVIFKDYIRAIYRYKDCRVPLKRSASIPRT
jgi:integrase